MSPPTRLSAARVVLNDLVGAGGDTVVRDGASLLIRRAGIVVRVRDADASGRTIAEREVRLARRLEDDGVPVTPLVGDRVVREVDDHVVTVWRWCPEVRSARSADLGFLAGQLRDDTASGGPGTLDSFDPLGHILDAVRACGDDPDANYVRDRVEALREPFEAATADDPSGMCVVHGDLHFGNVVVAEDGPLLTDLELGGWGGASFDTSPAVVAVRRYGAPSAGLDRFIAASGVDPRAWPGFETYVAVTELWVTAWAVSVAHQRADWAAEAARRVATLQGRGDEIWHLS